VTTKPKTKTRRKPTPTKEPTKEARTDVSNRSFDAHDHTEVVVMAIEREFVEKGMRRSQIDEFLADELERAGYGGMELARTPMGTEITLKAEKPGMVIGKGGKNIRQLTDDLEREFDLEDLQVDVQEVDEPDLNARIVADKLANALERGWYFRDAGRTTLSRIMESGAMGAEIVFSGKVTGARSRVVKFKEGYVKHCGEPAEEVVETGYGTAIMKLGAIGIQVRIIPPGSELPDKFEVKQDADVEELVPEAEATEVEVEEAETADEGIEELVGEAGDEETEETAEESEAEEAETVEEPEEAETEETAEADDEAPSSVDELHEKSYRELQKLAKEAGVKANLKTEELIDALADEYGLEGGDA
jgi:small subunit ribosomal protein S3